VIATATGCDEYVEFYEIVGGALPKPNNLNALFGTPKQSMNDRNFYIVSHNVKA